MVEPGSLTCDGKRIKIKIRIMIMIMNHSRAEAVNGYENTATGCDL